MSAAVSPIPNVKKEFIDEVISHKIKKEPVSNNEELFSKLRDENPAGVCLGLIESCIELFDKDDFNTSAKEYQRVHVEFTGKRGRDTYGD